MVECRPEDLFFLANADCWISRSEFVFLGILSELILQCVINGQVSITLLLHTLFYYLQSVMFFSKTLGILQWCKQRVHYIHPVMSN
jgi:hypothetical protein